MQPSFSSEIFKQHLKKNLFIYLFFLIIATIITYTQFIDNEKFEGKMYVKKAVGLDSIDSNVSKILFEYLALSNKYFSDYQKKNEFRQSVKKLFTLHTSNDKVLKFINRSFNYENEIFRNYQVQENISPLSDLKENFSTLKVKEPKFEVWDEEVFIMTVHGHDKEAMDRYLEYFSQYATFAIRTHMKKLIEILNFELKIRLLDRTGIRNNERNVPDILEHMEIVINEQINFLQKKAQDDSETYSDYDVSKPLIVILASAETVHPNLINMFETVKDSDNNIEFSTNDYFYIYRNYFEYVYPSLYLMGEENLLSFLKYLQKYEKHFLSKKVESQNLLTEKTFNELFLSFDPSALEDHGLSFFEIKKTIVSQVIETFDIVKIFIIYLFHFAIALGVSMILSYKKNAI